MPRVLMSCFLLQCVLGIDQIVAADHRDPANWVIEGCNTFSASKIKSAASRDFAVQLTTSLEDNPSELRQILERRIRDGYRSLGFPDARVQVRIDSENDKAEISIYEGKRIHAGELQVLGLNAPMRQRIRDAIGSEESTVEPWLEEENADDTKALWIPHEPARFDDRFMELVEKRVGRILGDSGFTRAQFNVSTNVAADQAILKIEIVDLGPPNLIQNIRFEGWFRNSPDVLLRYLDLETGVVLTHELKSKILKKLWDSGRFASHSLDVTPVANGCDVTIRVTEIANAPHLTTPLDDEQLVLKKLHHWITTSLHKDVDLVLNTTYFGTRFEMVLSKHGVLVLAKEEDTETMLYAIRFADTLGIFDLKHKQKYEFGFDKIQVTGALKLSASSQNPDQLFCFNFGVGWRSCSSAAPSFLLEQSISPAFFLATNYAPMSRCEKNDQSYTYFTKNTELEVDAETGALIVARFFGDEVELVVTPRKNYYGQISQQVCERERLVNQWDSERQLTSLLRFLADSDWSSLSQIISILGSDPIEVAEFLDRASNWKTMEGVDQWLAKITPKTNSFEIPSSVNDSQKEHESLSGNSAIVAYAAMMACNDLFQRDSWPWHFGQAILFFATGHQEHAKLNLKRVSSLAQNGPVANWLLAELTQKDPPIAAAFAYRGRKSLNEANFDDDVSKIIDSAEHWLIPTLNQMSELSDDEVKFFAKLLGLQTTECQQALQKFRELKSSSGNDRQKIESVMNQLFESDLSSALDTRLWHFVYNWQVAKNKSAKRKKTQKKSGKNQALFDPVFR